MASSGVTTSPSGRTVANVPPWKHGLSALGPTTASVLIPGHVQWEDVVLVFEQHKRLAGGPAEDLPLLLRAAEMSRCRRASSGTAPGSIRESGDDVRRRHAAAVAQRHRRQLPRQSGRPGRPRVRAFPDPARRWRRRRCRPRRTSRRRRRRRSFHSSFRTLISSAFWEQWVPLTRL